ncbi:hypothetical protein B6A27_00590 [Anoxybacillus sp. UARK-01]|jgi:hypothetical protein|nr:hypothetical protein B6A27_00590 [Anoxybacillus sp. UARK-01]
MAEMVGKYSLHDAFFLTGDHLTPSMEKSPTFTRREGGRKGFMYRVMAPFSASDGLKDACQIKITEQR